MVDDMGLSVHAFRLYAHMKRVAGDSGVCWQSTRTLARACNMSVGKVSGAKKELRAKGLIARDEQLGISDRFIIVDVWDRNYRTFTEGRSPDEQDGEDYYSPDERDVHDMNAGRSSGETKNEHYK